MKSKSLYFIMLLALSSVFVQSCASVFSEMQSARTVGKERIELTPSYSFVFGEYDGETQGVQNHVGVQAGYGINEDIDIRLRFEYLWSVKNTVPDFSYAVVGIGPKFSLLKDKIAFTLPIGRALGEGTENTWEIHPTLIFSFPIVKDNLEINIAPKYLLRLVEDADDMLALNVGFSIGSDILKWSIRPEYGILFIPGETGSYSHVSLGLSTNFGK